MKTSELLPCPFCGGVAGKTTDPIGYGEAYCIIACTQCDCCVNVSDPDFEVVERKAVDAWNTRVYPPEVQAAIDRSKKEKVSLMPGGIGVCPNCLADIHAEITHCCHCGQRLDWSEE